MLEVDPLANIVYGSTGHSVGTVLVGGEEAAMAYRLQMSAEIYDWLAELRGSDPPAAVLAAQALAALAADGDRLGPPLVTAVEGRLRPEELLPALDRRYQAGLESVTAMRRRVAEAATLRKDIERQLAELESPRAVQDEAAGLRRP